MSDLFFERYQAANTKMGEMKAWRFVPGHVGFQQFAFGGKMECSVRFGPGLAQAAGAPRLQVTTTEGATLGDLLLQLKHQYPGLEEKLPAAVAVVAGKYTGREEQLQPGQEVALLLPVAGG